MASTKHLKIKNTGILFELLTRQITADVLNGKDNSVAIKTMKHFFSESTELGKELELYNVLMNEKFTTEKQAEKLIEAVIKSRQRLSNKKLKLEKYNLIKNIKESYDIVNFFSSRIPNYKVFASVYKLFEYNTNQHRNNPTDEIRNKYSIVEHIINKKVDSSVKTNKIIETYKKSEKDLRLLTYSMLVDKFNNKYYLSYSTGDTHYICYAVGENPMGPFYYAGRILEPVVGWTTHHSICEFNGRWFLFYHDASLSKGVTHLRCMKVTEIFYDEEGLIKTIYPYRNK